MTAITTFTSVLVNELQDSPREYLIFCWIRISEFWTAAEILTLRALSFHGLYRAIICTGFSWSYHGWASISEHLNVLFEYDVIERLNRSLLNVVQAEDGEDDIKNYIQALLSRHELSGRPLMAIFLEEA